MVVKNVMLYTIFTNVAITKIKFKTFVILNTNFLAKSFLKTPTSFFLSAPVFWDTSGRLSKM